MKHALLLILYLQFAAVSFAAIDRQAIVSRYNPTRNASSLTTPMQIGNGNFAFGADITGLQTFQPYGILSSWGWNNDSIPAGKTQADIDSYQGASWLEHGRPVQYDFGGDPVIEKWLISNPNRVNLGRIGLIFYDSSGVRQDIAEVSLNSTTQTTDLWTGILTSRFTWDTSPVAVQTAISQEGTDVVSVQIASPLLKNTRLGLFLDFPWNDGTNKFSAPFVGTWNATDRHTSELSQTKSKAQIIHRLSTFTSYTSVSGDAFNITRDSDTLHRYTILPATNRGTTFSVSFAFSSQPVKDSFPFQTVASSSRAAWSTFWRNSGFIDLVSRSTDVRANELQRRIILSRYLMRVNEAGDSPPQESGLVNNGWYGKFHMEMYFWHTAQWALWGNWDLLRRSSSIYSRFLPTALARAQIQQGYSSGARWPKMTDPSGRSAPGQINNVLLWQQPHPLLFAQYEYRAFPQKQTLEKWFDVVRETANWMSVYAWWNESTSVYDLGPPIHVVSEDTPPNSTQNPAFELAYWRLGLGWAHDWLTNMGEEVPEQWSKVREGLAALPTSNGIYDVYEGINPNWWNMPESINDHPALVGLHGWLPPSPGLDLNMAKVTAEKVWTHWNMSNCWGWDFPMLAMSAARNGDPEKAVDWLLDPLFQFDDIGMPVGGVRVPTPYFPGSGALLYAVAMMAGGWDGADKHTSAPGFPTTGWVVRTEGIGRAL
ncbi:Six-hairpin glycosidase-like protein [Flagelloscypha sp. PMI_526]|nr:Six-hairpin glycosidase-like protein [Flagelloscypha sp. PMI_526]